MADLSIDRNVQHLHPKMRAAVAAVLAACQARSLPFAVFEGYRSPERQEALYAQGRGAPGAIVTNARAGQSYHQYGLAVDMVGFVNGQWTWDLPTQAWYELHAFGRTYGLDPLGFEQPHLQIAGLNIEDLIRGDLPAGGDDTWKTMLPGFTPVDPMPPVPAPQPLGPKVLSADDLNAQELQRVSGA